MYRIIDHNMVVRNREIATTPFSDVAELMALGYTRMRYGSETTLFNIHQGHRELKPIEIRDDEDRLIAAYGLTDRPSIGRLD